MIITQGRLTANAYRWRTAPARARHLADCGVGDISVLLRLDVAVDMS